MVARLFAYLRLSVLTSDCKASVYLACGFIFLAPVWLLLTAVFLFIDQTVYGDPLFMLFFETHQLLPYWSYRLFNSFHFLFIKDSSCPPVSYKTWRLMLIAIVNSLSLLLPKREYVLSIRISGFPAVLKLEIQLGQHEVVIWSYDGSSLYLYILHITYDFFVDADVINLVFRSVFWWNPCALWMNLWWKMPTLVSMLLNAHRSVILLPFFFLSVDVRLIVSLQRVSPIPSITFKFLIRMITSFPKHISRLVLLLTYLILIIFCAIAGDALSLLHS